MAALRRFADPAERAKVGDSSRGRPVSAETRAKLSAAGKGRHVSAKTRAKRSAALLGHVVSPETRAKIGAANTGRASPLRGRSLSVKTRKKISAAAKRRFSDPAQRSHLSAVRTRHGHSAARTGRASPTYHSWQGMLQRCENPKATGYSIYGGRGIIIDDRWRVFENFLADMGERPPGTTLDRRDNDGNYDVDNCRWATASEQRVNQRPRAKLSPEIRRERDRDRHRAAARRKEAA